MNGYQYSYSLFLSTDNWQLCGVAASRASGGIGRHARFRILWRNPSGFESRLAHTSIACGPAKRGKVQTCPACCGVPPRPPCFAWSVAESEARAVVTRSSKLRMASQFSPRANFGHRPKFGRGAGTRTPDPLIKSQLLYQLSYTSMKENCNDEWSIENSQEKIQMACHP